MAIKHIKMHPPGTGHTDINHAETDSTMVLMGDAQTLEQFKIAISANDSITDAKLMQTGNNILPNFNAHLLYNAQQLALKTNQTDFVIHLNNNTTAHSPEVVVNPTLINSWVNKGGGDKTAVYWKDMMQIVHLEGTISSGVIGTVAFNLPVGYRPGANLSYPIVSYGLFGYITIFSDGRVYVSVGDTRAVDLNTVSFRAGV